MTAPTQPLSSEDMKFERAGPMPRDTARWRNGLGAIALALCALALLTPISRIAVQGRVGLLLVLAAVLELSHGFRRSIAAGQRGAWIGGGITLAMGVLLVNAPYFTSTAIGPSSASCHRASPRLATWPSPCSWRSSSSSRSACYGVA
jgi:hypothetical protein